MDTFAWENALIAKEMVMPNVFKGAIRYWFAAMIVKNPVQATVHHASNYVRHNVHIQNAVGSVRKFALPALNHVCGVASILNAQCIALSHATIILVISLARRLSKFVGIHALVFAVKNALRYAYFAIQKMIKSTWISILR